MDHQTPDSAGTGTAYLTGVKTNMGMIGVSARAQRGNCLSSAGTSLTSILDWSQAKGNNNNNNNNNNRGFFFFFIAPLTTHAWAASQRFTMRLKLKTQHYKSTLKWKGDRGASKTPHIPVKINSLFTENYILLNSSY